MKTYNANTTIIGAGIAGLTAAIELLEAGKTVILLDREKSENLGGLAKESFGGMFYINSPQQKRLGIKDSIEQAKKDWFSFAEFADDEIWGKKWAEYFLDSTQEVYQWVRHKKVSYFPVVHWVERGLFQPGNSVPRFHMVWGTGFGLTEAVIKYLKNHPNFYKLQILHEHKAEKFESQKNKITRLTGLNETTETLFECLSENYIVATGGINGSLEKVRKNWHKDWNKAPKTILNGSHHFSDGLIHDEVARIGGQIVHLDLMWNYAAGIPHPFPKRPNHGISLVPPKSALWLNFKGQRIGQNEVPLITAFDTRYLVTKICEQEKQYSWQVLNKKIVYKELSVSGSEFNSGIKNKKILAFLYSLLFGNKELIKTLEEKSPEYITAFSIEELAEKMNKHMGTNDVDINELKKSINSYDANFERGKSIWNDEQIRRIEHTRQYRGDKIRTCHFQKINDKKAYPLVAIKENILSRKSLGGIRTNLKSQVLSQDDIEFKNLYAVGEAAGFGGGGSHGKRALEGTFLSTCIFTAKKAAEHIIQNSKS